MKQLVLSILILLSVGAASAQVIPPDTLQLETKTGEKIILVGKDILKFKAMKVDSLIGKALIDVKDSLMVTMLPKADTVKAFIKNKNKRIFALLPKIGAGLVKDKLSPSMGLSLDFAPQRLDYRGKWGMYTFINIALNAQYFFEKDLTGNHTYTNIFLEGSLGNRINNRTKLRSRIDEFAFGAGYLIRNSGGYFEKNTWKLFGQVVPARSFLMVRPEIYLTDNFRKVFPGISMGVKLN